MDREQKTMGAALIELQNLKKVFYTKEVETWAINGIDLTVNAGEYISITGPSGCGKSTLLSVLGLLNSSSEGNYLLDGVNVSELTQTKRAEVRNRQIGFIFQAFNLIGDMTVLENVELLLTYRKELNRKERRQMAEDALKKVEMEHRAKHYPAQLSGGQQQRVAIARAIVRQPKILIADEPTGNLDPRHSWDIVKLLEKINRYGTTVLLTTHNVEIVNKLKRRVITLEHGKITSDQVSGSYKQ